MADGAERHTPLAVIEEYLSKGVQGAFGVAGEPVATVLVNPRDRTVGIRIPATGREPELANFENLSFETLLDGDDTVYQLKVRTTADAVDEVYAWLCSILDRLQLAGESPAESIEASLDSLAGILAVRRGLSEERQIGLFGELVALLALCDAYDAELAVESWRGPLGEEHDFGLQSLDLEVKTTPGERRAHWISSATQLLPTGGRTLHLLSIQLTQAGAGGGRSLPEVVADSRAALAARLAQFEDLLSRDGYRDADARLYTRRWVLRSPPAFFEVDGTFPALTQPLLDSVVPASERLMEVRFRIDLTGLEEAEPAFPVVGCASLGDIE